MRHFRQILLTPFSKKNPLLVDRYRVGKNAPEDTNQNVDKNEHKNGSQKVHKSAEEAGAIGILTDFIFRVLLATKTGMEMNYRIAYKAIERQRAKADFFDKIGKVSTYYRDSTNVTQKSFDQYKDAIDTLIRKCGVGENNEAVVGMFFMAHMEQVACGDPLGMQIFLEWNDRIFPESVQIRDT